MAVALAWGQPPRIPGGSERDDNICFATPIEFVIEGFRKRLGVAQLAVWSGKGAGALEGVTSPDGLVGDEPEVIERLARSFVAVGDGTGTEPS